MNKITELRKTYNYKGVKYIYVQQTDYTLKPISINEVEILFKPEFWEYYGVAKYKIRNDNIFYSNEEDFLNNNQLLEGYDKDRIRDIIRNKFKPHIISYIERQKEIDDFVFEEIDDFDFEVESNNADELTTDFDFDEVEQKLDNDIDEFLISSPTLSTAKVTEYFESLFKTEIEPSNPIIYYIEEASKKLKHLMRERELQQKISNKEKEIEDLKSLLNENKKSIELTDEIIREIKKDL